MEIKAGLTSISIPVSIQDSSSTTGDGLSGLAYNTSGLVASYWRQGGSRVAITLATLAAIDSAWSSGGFKEADATHLKGDYRLDLPDAALATGARWVIVELYGAANMMRTKMRIDFKGWDALDTPLTASAIADAVAAQTAVAAGLANMDAAVSTLTPLSAAQVRNALGMANADLDAQLDAIFADTSALPTDPADQSLIIAATDAIMTRLGAPAGASVSADVAAVKAQTAAIEVDTQDLQSRVPAALTGNGLMKSDTLRVNGIELTGNGDTVPVGAA